MMANAVVILTLIAGMYFAGAPLAAQTAHAGGPLPLGSGFSSPNGVAVDGSGNVFVASQGDNAVYEIVAVDGVVSPSSTVKTIGNGFSSPNGVAVDGSGNVFVADSGNSMVKQIVAIGGVVSSSSIVNTIGSGFNQPQGVAVDASGNVFVADSGNGMVKQIVASGGVVSSSSTVNTIGSGFNQPTDVAVDASGNVFVADYNNSAVYEVIAVGGVVSSSSTVNTLGSGFNAPNGLTVDGNGNIFVADYGNNAVKQIVAVGGVVSSSSTVNTLGSSFNGPTGVAVDGRGNVFVADQGNGAIKEIVTGARRLLTTAVASASVPLSVPFTFDTGGSIGASLVLTQGAVGLDFADAGTGSCTTNGTSHVYASGETCTVDVTFTPKYPGSRLGAVQLTTTGGVTIATAHIYGTGTGPRVTFPGNMTVNTIGSGFSSPNGVAVDGSGNVFVADANHNAVKEIVAVNGVVSSGSTVNTISSGFNSPNSVAVDGSGNVFVADMSNNVVKEIVAVNGVVSSSSTVITIGNGFNHPSGVAVDGSGNVFVADASNDAVKEIVAVNGVVSSSSTVNTIGSGFSGPDGVAVDGSGNVFVADTGNNAVKMIVAVNGVVNSSSTVITIGNGFNHPDSVAVDGSGNVFVADASNNAVRGLPLASPPSLSFASTGTGSTSSDSPQTVTIANSGNADLSILVPTTGLNPSISTGFALGNSGTCPQLNTSSSVATLTQGSSCTMLVSFSPVAAGSNSGSLILTDNNLNASPSTSQTIALNGTATAGVAIHLSVSGPNAIVSYTLYSFTVTALNAGNSVATGYNGTAVLSSSDPGFINLGPVTLVNGVGTVNGGFKTAGAQTLVATDTVNSTITGTAGFTVQPGPATHLSVLVPATAVVGTAVSLTVSAFDLYGNLATSYSGTVHFTSTDGTATLPADATITGGTGTFSATLKTPGSQTITATDTINSLSGTSNGITVTAPNFVVTTTGIAPAITLTGPLLSYTGAGEVDGFAFKATKTETIIALGIFAGSSLTLPAGPSFAVGLWTSSGTLLASTSVTAADTAIGSSYYHSITPITLTAGQSYVVGAQKGGGVLTYFGGAYTMADGIQYQGSRWITSSSLTMPTGYDGAASDPGYIGANFLVSPGGSGQASNCTAQTTPGIGTDVSCSLRDALQAAASAGAGNITFDATVFATAKTIGLGTDTLTLPSNTTVQGRTTGSGATLANLVTVSGGGTASVFTVNSGVTNTVLANLTITGGNASSGGGGIYNDGVLTVSDSTITGNTTSSGGGGGILNLASLTLKNSSIANNTVASIGAGLYNPAGATATLVNSTFSGNTAPGSGGGIYNNGGTLVITGSTVSGNSCTLNGGGVISPSGSLTIANSIVAGNSCATTGADISGSYTDGGGNIASADNSGTSTIAINLSPLGNYGGPVQTMLPLPGSPAICAGVVANIPGGITTDQRGLARTTIYGSTPCADSGAAQSNYAIHFGTQPSNVLQNTAMIPAPTVTLAESGVPFAASSVSIPLSLTGAGALSGASASTSGGVATYSALKVNTAGTGDKLVANLVLNSATTTALSATSSSFNVTSAVTQLAFGTSPAPTITAGGNAGSAVTVKEEGSDGSLVTTAADSITLSVTGPASYTKSYTVTAVNGVATFDLSGDALTTAGGYSYTASLTGVTSATSSATVSADSANAISVVSGSGQSAVIGAAFANPLSVKVVDAYNNPVSGATVTFTAPGTGSGATFSAATATASDGTTSATATANGIVSATAYTVTASVAGATTLANFTLTNTKASTSVTVTPSATSIVYGQPVTINAGVTPNNVAGSVPSGSVTFYDGATALTPDSTLAGAASSYIVSVPAVGSRTYGAQYAGDTNFSQSSLSAAASPVVIGKASSALTPATTSETLTYNAGGTISVSVAGQFSGAGIAQPTGSITYTIGGGSPQSATIAAGSAIVTIPAAQAVGTFTITVNYAGDGNYNPAAAATIALTVNRAAATVALGNLSASYDANAHTATATTIPAGLTVTFTYDGSATAPTAAGSYTVVGTIDDPNYQGSATGTLTIGKTDSVITWPTPAPIVYGTALSGVQLNATADVPGAFAYSPIAGTVLAAGAQTLNAVFTPTDTANYNGATRAVSLTVNKHPAAITLISSAMTVTPGQAVTFTATVAREASGAPGGGGGLSNIVPPSGTVSFYDGATLLSTSSVSTGVATYSTGALAPGMAHAISATFSGDANYLGANVASSVNVTVASLDFTLIGPGTTYQTVIPGGSVSFTYQIAPLYGVYPDAVTFAVSGLPPGATYSLSGNHFAPNAGPQTITLTVQTAAVTAQNSENKLPPWSLALLFLPLAGAGRLRRSSHRLRRTLLLTIFLVLSGAGLMGISGCGSGNGFLAQQPKDYAVTVTATSGTTVHTSTVTLNLQ